MAKFLDVSGLSYFYNQLKSKFAAADHTHTGLNASSAAKLTTARKIDGVNFNGTADIAHYGTCSTAAATAAKTVSLANFALATGAKVTVKFTVTNTASSPTLNVNSTGAKAIQYRGAAISAAYLAANRVYTFVYDGTYYQLVGDIDTNTNTTYSAGTGISLSGTTFSNSGVRSVTAGSSANQLSVNTGGTSSTITINNVANATSASAATKLSTARTIRTNLASTSTASFDGSANVTPGVTGTLPLANGGTGATTAAAARNALGLGNTTGALPIANGGTGATTAAAARNALGLGNTTGALPIANGGTGATTAANAIKALLGSSAIGNTTKPVYYDGAGALKACADSVGGGGIVAALLEQNGYVKFANGLIIQWGFSEKKYTITLPIAYTDTHFVAIIAQRSNSQGWMRPVTAKSLTDFTIGTADNYDWISLGK